MTDQAQLPATTATGSQLQSTTGLRNWLNSLPARLDDSTLTQVETIASSPLPVLEACDEAYFLKGLRILYASLPKRPTDRLSGKLMAEGYKLKLMHLPREAIDHLVNVALDGRFFPSIAECQEIVGGWKRSDGLVKARADTLARRERQARFDALLHQLDRGELSQTEIDALPERTCRIAEDRGSLRRVADGSYRPRDRLAGFDPTLSPAEAMQAAVAAFPVSPERRNAA